LYISLIVHSHNSNALDNLVTSARRIETPIPTKLVIRDTMNLLVHWKRFLPDSGVVGCPLHNNSYPLFIIIAEV